MGTLAELKALPLTPLGRRILARHALVSRDGDIGAEPLARLLGVRERTVWQLLKDEDPAPDKLPLAEALCTLLGVHPSWLLDVIVLDSTTLIDFDLTRRRNGHR